MEKKGARRMDRRSGRSQLGEREKRRLGQMAVCLVLFLTVFFAKGADKLGPLRADLTAALTADADLQTAFTDLGWAVAARRGIGETARELWSDVFAPRREVKRGGEGGVDRVDALGPAVLTPPPAAETGDPFASLAAAPAPEPEPTPEPEVEAMAYDGPALPKNVSMDKYALHLDETVSPVQGKVTSDFGWREHPIDGGEKFHYGVDIGVGEGTAVGAFAAGTVEYIGESDAYGRYLQIDHGGGVKSFYAHCSELCVQKGQEVAMGETVAKSGSTGHTTGPHLHFELKKDDLRLEPLYYIQPEG